MDGKKQPEKGFGNARGYKTKEVMCQPYADKPKLRLVNPLDEPITRMEMEKKNKASAPKKIASPNNFEFDDILLRAMKGKISEYEIRKTVLVLNSGLPMLRLLALCALSEVKWPEMSATACTLAFDSLKQIENDPDKNLRKTARALMEKILKAGLKKILKTEGEKHGERKAA